MARRYTDHQLLVAQLEHLQYCAFSEAVAKVLTERGDKDVHPYYNTLWKDDKSYNYYPSDVFPSWQWQPIGQDGKELPFAGAFHYTDEQLKQMTGTEITIWTRIKGEERAFNFKIQHRDLQPEARQCTIFNSYKNVI